MNYVASSLGVCICCYLRRSISLMFLFSLVMTTALAAATSSSQFSITDAILKDDEICKTPLNLIHSKHFKKCKTFNLPTQHSKFTVDQSDLFFCLALYDRLWQICQVIENSNSSTELLSSNQYSILVDGDRFDSEIDQMMRFNQPKKVIDVCMSLVFEPHPEFYKKTENFVAQLMEDETCLTSCFYSESTGLNPRCLALFRIDKEIRNIRNGTLDHKESDYKKSSALSSTDQRYYPHEHHSLHHTSTQKDRNGDYDDDYKIIPVDSIDEENEGRISHTVDYEMDLTPVMWLTFVCLLGIVYVLYCCKSRIAAKQQQVYRGLDVDASFEYDQVDDKTSTSIYQQYQPTLKY